ncbi:conserved hypothetical protein [Microcystis aeruginosa PCC 9807]|uniref:DUF2973 domain-containing protein n=2 Tax=Microcystis TaxID=1125 RepID=A0A552M938_9CHRO|nr:DUF2973 domain-containing protein [Microcystis aeruginosa]TRV02491.1 MAG: DUF2973 domain-containing protein [Microcystis wesenbergii Mw_MB_S_20031200_S109]TRV28990.1 MAG: DUF2973 domain-containing protein [Microcystis wesenbergii Mw_MB_S_20031200_S109D]CCI20379.1 conserved hypothetical protein [Microcystis aeruginosa PCC 9807]
MLHLIYILAFTVIAFLTINNLIRSLITVSMDSQKRPAKSANSYNPYGYPMTSHPELLDEAGQPINEPLLVIRSLTVEDARQQLDAIYNSSPSATKEQDEEI